MKKLVYVAHPLRGDVPGNMQRIEKIMKELSEEYQYRDYNFFSPLHGYSFHDPHGDQELVMSRCLDLLDRCDEIWVYGDWTRSEGCTREVRHAAFQGKRILFHSGNSSHALWKVMSPRPVPDDEAAS